MMQAHKQTRQTIVRLLSSMGSAKEISQYLKRFSQLDAKRFAVVKVGGAVLRDDLEALTSSLTFLQEVGLTPIVLHGAGPQLDEELSAAGIEKQTVDGLRVTSPQSLAIVRKVFQAQNLKLVEALQLAGARATSITGGVFEADVLGPVSYTHLDVYKRQSMTCSSHRRRAGRGQVPRCFVKRHAGRVDAVRCNWCFQRHATTRLRSACTPPQAGCVTRNSSNTD